MSLSILNILMARSQCTEPGPGQGTGQGMMDFYIMLCTFHITQGQGPGRGTGAGTNGSIPIHHGDRCWILY